MGDGAVQMLAKDNAALKRAGNALAAAALHVATEYDGVHRLMLAVSVWTQTIANEGGRAERFATSAPETVEKTA